MVQYTCEKCEKTFSKISNYKRHIIKKNGCKLNKNIDIRTEQLKCIIDEKKNLEIEKEKLKIESKKLEEIKQKIENDLEFKKRKQINKINRLNNILVNNIDDIKSCITSIDNKVEKIIADDQHQTIINNNSINNSISEYNNQSQNFSIQLAQPLKQRYDHISNTQILHILRHADFANSIGELTEAVYFNPKAPENMYWCVTDKTSKYGALEYNEESHTLTRTLTTDAISKSLSNLLYGMNNQIEQLATDCIFDKQQDLNYKKLFSMVGDDEFIIEYIDNIKNRAYIGRHFTKALWNHLGITVDKIKLRP